MARFSEEQLDPTIPQVPLGPRPFEKGSVDTNPSLKRTLISELDNTAASRPPATASSKRKLTFLGWPREPTGAISKEDKGVSQGTK